MELPSGTVTLLFTDIDGSTVLAERLADRWPGVLGEHNRILREAFSARLPTHGRAPSGRAGATDMAASGRNTATLTTTHPCQQPLAENDIVRQPLQVLGVHNDALLA